MHSINTVGFLQLFFYVFFSSSLIAQSDITLMLSFGTIRHYPTSKTENGRIKGLAAWDVLPEVKVGYCVNSKIQVDFGGQNPSLTSYFFIDQTSSLEESSVSSKALQSGSGYYKFFLNCKSKLKEVRKFSLYYFLGPSIIINRFNGLDYGATVNTSSSYTNGLTIYYQHDYAVYKTKLYGFALQTGFEIRYKKSATSSFGLNLGFNRGFVNFNEILVESFIYSNLNDRGKVLYNGTGLSLTLGYMFNLGQPKKEKD